jgi:hypothetical protein
VSYIVLRGRWCNIIVLNVQAPSREKSDDSKDSFYEKLEQVFLSLTKVPSENSIKRFLLQSGEREYFSNLLFGMRFCIRIVMVMVLE